MDKSNAILDLYSEARVVHHNEDGTYTALDSAEQEISFNDSDVSARAIVLDNAEKIKFLRAERDRKLSETDFWMFSDTDSASQAQLDYRQALRDITDTYSSLDTVVWPTKP